MTTESEDDFDDLFSDMGLTSNKLGRSEEAKNTLITKVLSHLDKVDFELENAESDVLADAYEYLIRKSIAYGKMVAKEGNASLAYKSLILHDL